MLKVSKIPDFLIFHAMKKCVFFVIPNKKLSIETKKYY